MNIPPNKSLLDLSGKTAIVTGGSLGIGYSIAYRLAEAGTKVVIAGRKLPDAQKAVEDIMKAGFTASAIQTDVSVEKDVANLVEKTISLYGSIDILVNNAGVFPFSNLLDLTPEMFDSTIAINLRGVYLTTKYVAKQMIAQGNGGKIINVTSIDALHPSTIGLSHYDASKHGVWGFTKNTALELAKYNIWVNAVAPGGVMTPGVAAMQAGGKPVALDRNPEAPKMEVPMGRMGVPDDIGKAVLFFASDLASYCTGSQLVVDGGYLLK